jgi:hypothetical protein
MTIYITPQGQRQVAPPDLSPAEKRRLRRGARSTHRAPAQSPTTAPYPRDAGEHDGNDAA